MTLNYDSMYEQVQASIAAQDKSKNKNFGNAAYREVFKPVVGGEYILRIVPSDKCGDNIFAGTFFRYVQYSWQHRIVGEDGKPKTKYEIHLSQRTFNKSCPISSYDYNYRKTATKEQYEAFRKMLSFREGHLINVLVIKDSKNSENEGKVKILDCPNSIWKMIDSTLRGDLDEEWSENLGTETHLGKKVMNLSDDGMNLVIKVTPDPSRKTSKGDPMPNYSTVRWQLKGAALGLSADEQSELMNKTHDLSKVNRVLPVLELEKLFNETFVPKLGEGAPICNYASKMTDDTPIVVNDTPVTEETPAPKKKLEPIDDEEPTFDNKPAPAGDVDTVGDVDDFLGSLGL